MNRIKLFFPLIMIMASASLSAAGTAPAAAPWWLWPLLLFVVTFMLGIVAVMGGVGGGVLFVPIVSGFFPFHLDYVRSAGLIVALSGSLAAGPGLLKRGLADLRLAIPIALITSTGAIAGALLGLLLPTNIVQLALGGAILAIVVLMLLAKNSDYPDVPECDRLATILRLGGVYREASTDTVVVWKTHHTIPGFIIFLFIGIMAGMFGLGAGWANVPTLNLLMGVPLKVAAATSNFLISITDTSAAWIYINNGAAIPAIIAPSVIGMMLGARIGVKLLAITKPKGVRVVVICMLIAAGIRAILKGLGL